MSQEGIYLASRRVAPLNLGGGKPAVEVHLVYAANPADAAQRLADTITCPVEEIHIEGDQLPPESLRLVHQPETVVGLPASMLAHEQRRRQKGAGFVWPTP